MNAVPYFKDNLELFFGLGKYSCKTAILSVCAAPDAITIKNRVPANTIKLSKKENTIWKIYKATIIAKTVDFVKNIQQCRIQVCVLIEIQNITVVLLTRDILITKTKMKSVVA